MSLDLSSYLDVFADEAREHLQNLNQSLLSFEKDAGNIDLVNVMFRSAHTLKGMSATMGFSEVAELTHKMENLLTPVRTGELKADAAIVEILFQCLDVLQEMTEAHINGLEHNVQISALVSQLESLATGGAQAAAAAAPAAIAGSSGYPAPLSAEQIGAAGEAAARGEGVYHLRISLEKSCEMRGVRAFMALRELKAHGSLIAVTPSEEEIATGEIGFDVDLILASPLEPELLSSSALNVSEIASARATVFAPASASAAGESAPAAASVFDLNEYDIAGIGQFISEGQRLDYVHVRLMDDCTLKSARAFMVNKALEAHGEIIAVSPSVEDIEFERFDRDLHFLVLTKSETGSLAKAVGAVSEIESVEVEEAYDPGKGSKTQASKPAAESKPVAATTPAAAAAAAESAAGSQLATTGADNIARGEGATRAAARAGQTIRVDTERLDMLLNMVGELVIGKTRLSQLGREVRRPDLSDAIEHFGHIVTDLQNIVMQTRMVPIETVFNRFPRMIRDLAKARGKQIELVMTGGETELDRTVVDEIGDPLVHLIRNSLDHGIEPADERRSAGKDPTGTLTLAAFHEGSNVFIQIRDDGRGIDPHKIKEIALRKGVITAERAAAMSNEEAVMLIFAAGFSTAEQVTDISGRGVGMDVVRSKIELLNGEVKVDTRAGEGTVVTIKLPLTLAIVQALLVEIATECFAIPLAYIEETLRLRPQDIQKANQQDVYLLRGEILPLVWMNRLLDSPEIEREDDNWRVVVVRSSRGRIGICVDRTIGQTEIVIKSLGQYLSNTKYISGGTILGDGTVALILDVTQIGT